MEQIKKFLQGKGFTLVLLACLLAAAAAGVWAVQTLRAQLQHSLTDRPGAGSTGQTTLEPEPAPGLDTEENELWLEIPEPAQEAAHSAADVPQQPDSWSGSSGGASGSGSVSEPSALHTGSEPAASSAEPASTQPFSGRVLNAYSGDELVYSKTLGDWRTHNGVDYAGQQGDTVASPVSGKVTQAAADSRWGGVVELEDPSGRVWRVCGVSSPAVAVGDTVTAGQTLGVVGTIGCECAEDSHIHLEVKQGEKYLDPAKLPE